MNKVPTIDEAISIVLSENSTIIKEYQGGKFGLMGLFTGKVMILTKGNYDGEVVLGAVMKTLQAGWDIAENKKDARIKELEKKVSDLGHTMEWISVEKELPMFNVNILAYYLPKTPVMGGRIIGVLKRIETKEKFLLRMLDENQFQLASKVTHWMPLPSPPEK